MLFLCSCAASCLHSYFTITRHISSTGSKVNVNAVMQQNRNIYMLFLCSCAASCLHSYFRITPHISNTGRKVNVDAVMQQNRNIYVVLMYLCSFMSPQLFYNNTSYKQHYKESECGCSHVAEQKYICCSCVAMQLHVSTAILYKNLI